MNNIQSFCSSVITNKQRDQFFFKQKKYTEQQQSSDQLREKELNHKRKFYKMGILQKTEHQTFNLANFLQKNNLNKIQSQTPKNSPKKFLIKTPYSYRKSQSIKEKALQIVHQRKKLKCTEKISGEAYVSKAQRTREIFFSNYNKYVIGQEIRKMQVVTQSKVNKIKQEEKILFQDYENFKSFYEQNKKETNMKLEELHQIKNAKEIINQQIFQKQTFLNQLVQQNKSQIKQQKKLQQLEDFLSEVFELNKENENFEEIFQDTKKVFQKIENLEKKDLHLITFSQQKEEALQEIKNKTDNMAIQTNEQINQMENQKKELLDKIKQVDKQIQDLQKNQNENDIFYNEKDIAQIEKKLQNFQKDFKNDIQKLKNINLGKNNEHNKNQNILLVLTEIEKYIYYQLNELEKHGLEHILRNKQKIQNLKRKQQQQSLRQLQKQEAEIKKIQKKISQRSSNRNAFRKSMFKSKIKRPKQKKLDISQKSQLNSEDKFFV